MSDWTRLLGHAASREETDGGIRYAFTSVDVDFEQQIRDLAAAEQGCCSFLSFGFVRVGNQIEMTVSAPPDGHEALRFIFSA